jgi:hypothetical protein
MRQREEKKKNIKTITKKKGTQKETKKEKKETPARTIGTPRSLLSERRERGRLVCLSAAAARRRVVRSFSFKTTYCFRARKRLKREKKKKKAKKKKKKKKGAHNWRNKEQLSPIADDARILFRRERGFSKMVFLLALFSLSASSFSLLLLLDRVYLLEEEGFCVSIFCLFRFFFFALGKMSSRGPPHFYWEKQTEREREIPSHPSRLALLSTAQRVRRRRRRCLRRRRRPLSSPKREKV